MNWKETLEEMSEPQKKYAITKAKYEDVKSRAEEEKRRRDLFQKENDLLDRLQEISEGSDEEQEIQSKLDKVNEEIIGVEKELGQFRVEQELREARDELLEWCFDTLKNRTSSDVDFKYLWDKKDLPSVRDKLVDVAMRYRPSKDKK